MDETQSEPSLVTEDRLLDVLRELARREPLFHRRELVNSRADFERETADDFWETGASGRRYSREYVWAILKERYESSDQDEYTVEQWETRDFQRAAGSAPAAEGRPMAAERRISRSSAHGHVRDPSCPSRGAVLSA
jgi:hypothetical protein